MKKLKFAAFILFIIGLFVTADLAYNCWNACLIEFHDGIVVSGIISPIIFRNAFWSLDNFLKCFLDSLIFTFAIGLFNIILRCDFWKRKAA